MNYAAMSNWSKCERCGYMLSIHGKSKCAECIEKP